MTFNFDVKGLTPNDAENSAASPASGSFNFDLHTLTPPISDGGSSEKIWNLEVKLRPYDNTWKITVTDAIASGFTHGSHIELLNTPDLSALEHWELGFEALASKSSSSSNIHRLVYIDGNDWTPNKYNKNCQGLTIAYNNWNPYLVLYLADGTAIEGVKFPFWQNSAGWTKFVLRYEIETGITFSIGETKQTYKGVKLMPNNKNLKIGTDRYSENCLFQKFNLSSLYLKSW